VKPFFLELSDELKDINFLMIDIDENRDLAERFEIMSIPTFVVYENGKEIKKQMGMMPKNLLKQFIEN
jgi:thioredoxin 1